MKKLGLFLLILAIGCTDGKVDTPKPKGYFRLKFPAKKYIPYNSDAPFTFEYPTYAKMVKDTERNAQPYWNNLDFPQFNGRLHLTYHGVFSAENYNKMTEAARTLAMKHTVKASAIDQRIINYPDKKVYGIYYEIQGNTASAVQFFLTDSSKHYFRGALYFNEAPKYDSIQPIIKFIKKDIDRMIETFKWKK
ncbi:gliding motility lipoprotein GldD [Pedobacter sp. Du54]|uniref:gliding motility lipoprotein GldD n=1 Tax=Pedobacter anseongensis TaxID=3133439 RepID=UPI0030B5EEFE